MANVVEKALERKRAAALPGSAEAAKKFTAERREMYLDLLRHGELRSSAARKSGVSPQYVARVKKLDPGFQEECVAAELEALEKAETKLWEAVEAGEPWAIQLVLKTGDRNRWGDRKDVHVQVEGKIEVEAGERLARIKELESRLAERAELGLMAGGPVLDVESWEDPAGA